MFSTIRLWIYGAFSAVVLFVGAWLYRAGGKNAKAGMREDDYENAKDVRRRVSVNRADELRKYDDAGWRDR